MFYIPAGWLPYYVEWILSFPRAPLGSVSINIWGIACASMIGLVADAIKALYVLVTKKPVGVPPEKQGKQPMAFEGRSAKQPSAKPSSAEKREKKEL